MQRSPSSSSRTALPLIATLRLTPNGPSGTPVPTTNYPYRQKNRRTPNPFSFINISNPQASARSICCLKATRYVCSREPDIFAIGKFDMFRFLRNKILRAQGPSKIILTLGAEYLFFHQNLFSLLTKITCCAIIKLTLLNEIISVRRQ